MIIGIATWFLKIISGGILDKALDAFTKQQDATVEGKRIDSETTRAALLAYVESQKVESGKWQFPWFWIMAGLLVGPVILFFWALTLYGIFWHADGPFPQMWTIAAFPPVYEEWATTAFHWIFAPALGVGAIAKILKK